MYGKVALERRGTRRIERGGRETEQQQERKAEEREKKTTTTTEETQHTKSDILMNWTIDDLNEEDATLSKGVQKHTEDSLGLSAFALDRSV